MNISTFKGVKSLAMVAVLALSAMTSSAATFVVDGIVYKDSGNTVTIQKATASLTSGQEWAGVYTGDIVIPAKIEYNGKTYTVKGTATNAFQNSEITSLEIADGVLSLGRGSFQNCTQLVRVKLPADLVTFNGDLFSGCSALEEIVIPGTVKELASNQFKDCTSLKKVTFEDGATPLELSAAAFPGSINNIEECVMMRALGEKYTDMNTKLLRGATGLQRLVIGGSFLALPASYCEGATSLKEVVFLNDFNSLGTSAFANTGLEDFTVPATITTIPSSCFQGCKHLNKVTLAGDVTTIGEMAFYKSTLAEINLPASLTSIGQMAFSGTRLSGELVIPEAVTRIGIQAFANNTDLTSVSIPASVTSLGDGLFMGCSAIAKYTVAAENGAYLSVDDKYITTLDGATVICYAPAAEGTAFACEATALAPYALYKAASITSVELPNCVSYGDYSLNSTGLTSLVLKGQLGRYVAGNCAALTELSIDGSEAGYGVAANCANLAKVNFLSKLTTVKQDAFLNCSALESLDLGSILAILEADCFTGSGLKAITVGATYPASMAEGVFTEGCGIVATVPVDLVDTYKAAKGWSLLEIVGDANVVAGGEDVGMPHGLYYAGTDNMIHCVYADGNTDTYDVGGVPHTFQLTQFNNRIYGASAGKKFVYSATGSVDGDGKLFYISQVGGTIYQAVLLDNTGNNAYKDPFGLYVYGDTLYVNDRNVCIRKIPADALALPLDYPSWMENNWMAYYGAQWSYGCIKSGFAITQSEDSKGEPEPLYWLGMKYNGNGIYRFKEANIGTSSSNVGPASAYAVAMNAMNPIFTTFYVDEANGHMYIYLECAGSTQDNWAKAGLYRLDLSVFDQNPDPQSFAELNPQLIDGSPVKYEGSGTNEHVGVPQLAPDERGEYLYWCYRAPSAEEAASTEGLSFADQKAGHYWWAEAFDATNPLHQSGIKRLRLGEENPAVELVVAGVEGYGVCANSYEGSTQPDAVKAVAPVQANLVTVAGDAIIANANAQVAVYDAAGTLVVLTKVAAGQSVSIADVANGVYVVCAQSAAGQQIVKIAK